MDVTVRPAVLEDARRICDLNRDSLGYDYPFEQAQGRLREILSMPHHHIFVAEQGGGVIGYVHAGNYDCTYSDPFLDILSLAVDSAAQKHGVGRRLMEAVEAMARAGGRAGIRLTSGSGRTGAHAFYERIGYFSHKTSKNFSKTF